MTTITIDGTKGGRAFDGLGAISGGGGNSVQLISYPEPQRGDILDYLFKPGSAPACKSSRSRSGGTPFSSAGRNQHEHSRRRVSPDGGYEWWLMEEAKACDPSIKLYGLAWRFPAGSAAATSGPRT